MGGCSMLELDSSLLSLIFSELEIAAPRTADLLGTFVGAGRAWSVTTGLAHIFVRNTLAVFVSPAGSTFAAASYTMAIGALLITKRAS